MLLCLPGLHGTCYRCWHRVTAVNWWQVDTLRLCIQSAFDFSQKKRCLCKLLQQETDKPQLPVIIRTFTVHTIQTPKRRKGNSSILKMNSDWKERVAMVTSTSKFNCEAMTAALCDSFKIQLCRHSKLDRANQRRCSCSTVYNAYLMKPKVKEKKLSYFINVVH